MIRSRVAVGNFVCLRCQVRRLSYNAPTTAIADARPFAGRNVNRSQIRYHGTDASSNDAAPAENSVDISGELDNRRGHDASDSKRPFDDARNRHLRLREKVVYWRGRDRLVPMTQDLSMRILGKPAEALIMKELGGGFRFRDKDRQTKPKRSRLTRGRRKIKNKTDDGEVKEKNESVDDEETSTLPITAKPWDGLDQNRTQDPTPDEIQAYISELRPTGDTLIPQRQFDDLIETLVVGFTNKQLARYVMENPGQVSFKDLPGGNKAPWVEDRKPWTSENTLSRQTGASSLQELTGRSKTPAKEALVLRLMQDCWGLSVRELVTGMGRLDVHIRDPEFSLLLVGSRRWLQAISRVYLAKVGGRVELRRSDRLMRIFAPKAVAETILSDINDLFRFAVTERIRLDSITPDTPSQGALDRLAELTNSHIKYDEGSRGVDVSWIHKQKAGTNEAGRVENVAEKVYRLLLTAYRPTSASTSTTVIPSLEAGDETGSLIFDHGIRLMAPPWNFGIGSWARLQRPQGKVEPEDPVVDKPPCEASVSLLRWPVDTNFREHFHFFKDRHVSFGGDVSVSGRWSIARTSTQATFGHLMHWHQESFPAGTRMPVTTQWKSPRMLFPATPSLLHRDLEEPQPAGPYRTEVVISFVPSPLDPSTKAHQPPTLQLRFLTRENIVRGIQSATLFAIHDSHQADVLLPSGPVDARIVQRQVSMLRGPDLHSVPHMKPIREFAMRSTLDLKGNVFHNPASVKGLSLPAYLMGDGKSQPVGDSGEEEFVTLDYLFAGVELHRRVDSSIHDENLVYTSIRDPLQPGRNRAEVSVHPSLPPTLGPDGVASETSGASLDEVEKARAELLFATPEVASERFLQGMMKLATNNAMKWAVV